MTFLKINLSAEVITDRAPELCPSEVFAELKGGKGLLQNTSIAMLFAVSKELACLDLQLTQRMFFFPTVPRAQALVVRRKHHPASKYSERASTLR